MFYITFHYYFRDIVLLVSLIFLKRSPVFPIPLFSSVSLRCLHRKAFLALLTSLRDSAFTWVCLSPSPLLFASLPFSAICGLAKSRTRLSNGTTTTRGIVVISDTSYCKGLSMIRHVQPTVPPDSLDLDKLPARHGVPHTRLCQRVNVFHDDKGGLLEGDDAQMVVVRLAVGEGLVPGPHGMPQAQGLVLPLAHLRQKDKDTLVLSCTTGFSKEESSRRRGTGEEVHHPRGFSVTYLNTHICCTLREMGIKGKATPCPGLSPD